MSAGLRMVHGVTHFEPSRARDGYTLFAPMYGRNVWLIDMWGTILHRWQVENLPGNSAGLLQNTPSVLGISVVAEIRALVHEALAVDIYDNAEGVGVLLKAFADFPVAEGRRAEVPLNRVG